MGCLQAGQVLAMRNHGRVVEGGFACKLIVYFVGRRLASAGSVGLKAVLVEKGWECPSYGLEEHTWIPHLNYVGFGGLGCLEVGLFATLNCLADDQPVDEVLDGAKRLSLELGELVMGSELVVSGSCEELSYMDLR